MKTRSFALVAVLATLAACEKSPDFSARTMAAAQLGRVEPKGFLFGTATAAHQIEGGNTNDWTAWEPGNFPDGSPHIENHDSSAQADESWDRFDTDLATMQTLGANAYRFSVEWSRLEPQEGVFDDTALLRYHAWAQQLRAAGITPMVTLLHFTLPQWVSAQGGWENDRTLDAFDAFVRHVVPVLGDQVDFWCTLNEPNVYVVEGYLDGIWPPGKQDTALGAQVYARLLKAHARTAAAIRELDTVDADGDGHASRVGFAHHVRVFQPASSGTLDATITAITDDFINEVVPRAVRTGRIYIDVPGTVHIDEAVPGLQGSADFLGLNYYTRDHVRADLGNPSLSQQYTPVGRPHNDLGWDIYPQGLYQMLMRFKSEGLPIYITENGIADAEDSQRSDYLRAHVYALEQAISEGVDVRGYFHWSLMDNFEWASGYSARFGLYRVDFASSEKTRTPTKAVPVFQGIAAELGRK